MTTDSIQSQLIPASNVTVPVTRARIAVTFQRAGFHKYPSAPEDVSYLQSVHRHLFKFKVTINVHHDDREIEFHQFLNWIESLYANNTLNFDFKSCEMLARELATEIHKRYNTRTISVEVWEDGECGAIVDLEPTQMIVSMD